MSRGSVSSWSWLQARSSQPGRRTGALPLHGPDIGASPAAVHRSARRQFDAGRGKHADQEDPQLPNALATPISDAAGIVVSERNAPSNVLGRASVSGSVVSPRPFGIIGCGHAYRRIRQTADLRIGHSPVCYAISTRAV
jgi:hypothetical protein